jgi:hypothetical protein
MKRRISAVGAALALLAAVASAQPVERVVLMEMFTNTS